ncbi:MAG: hypothetical protein ED556_00775 [Winogradskyella sp.]|uniref:hypothetical protein n=1 Tax=Winogradskyella sp. TaxID=1883156 RepID=UPI000F3E1C07|nr:hypothetical protein [Winogradskyella sp.]RNC87755.1 MAG: hypothetical protein ED556_00775 [Winogradskyella sp.]
MKRLSLLALLFMLLGCGTARLVEDWKNPDITTYAPTKVLVVGMTSDIEAREHFENLLNTELEYRGAETIMSLERFAPELTTEKMTDEELKTIENSLIDDGFDTILFTKVVGVEDKIEYKKAYDGFDETYRKFKDEFLMYQDIYYNPDYYNEYTVYHAETSMYCICPTKDRELIWKGYIDVVDPVNIEKTISEYVNTVIAVLEERQLIEPKIVAREKPDNTIINQ